MICQLVVTTAALAQEVGDKPADATPEPTRTLPAEHHDSREHLTAEDVLRALQRERPQNRIIQPASRNGQPPDEPDTLLLPEGHPIINRSGTLIRVEASPQSWWQYQFDDPIESAADQTRLAPMKVLPNATLEPMVQMVVGARSTTAEGQLGNTQRETANADSAGPLRFEVSGETTVFNGENFLLVRFASRARESAPPTRKLDPQGVAPADEDEGGAETSGSIDDTAPAEGNNSPGEKTPAIAPDSDVEDVLAMMQSERPSQDPLSMVAVSAASAPVDADVPIMSPEGAAIANRPGRLVKEGLWWTLVFESDHSDYPELPLRLLPCKNLETMIHEWQREPNGLVFVVSGQLTVYENENYLLIRTARRFFGTGNLTR